jgi:glycosyltransferase involved in cell wall biosynthesis
MVSVITPTCDRPAGLALTERWMARQTRLPDEWIVVDGGTQPATISRLPYQRVLRRPGGVGADNFVRNLIAGLDAAQGDQIIFWEDDDYYAPTHLEQTLALLDEPGICLVGDPKQRYYNVGARRWRIYNNKGSSLCQTGMAREALPWCREVIQACHDTKSYGVDGRLWVPMLCGTMRGTLRPLETVVGIKGVPGQVGLGVGHRAPIVSTWTADPALTTLRSWIGDDVDVYAPYQQRQEATTHGISRSRR